MTEALEFLWLPFLAALVLTGIHAYFGLHVLARNIIFVDLALAQISALGATVAFMVGYLPQSLAAYGYSLAFTLAGAALLSTSRRWVGRVTQETIIGVIYVASAAAAFLLIDKAPQGAEHIKQLLVGSILTANSGDVARLTALYGAIGVLHWLLRGRFVLLTANAEEARRRGIRVALWDFLFFATFGVVVTSSVAIAGVLLVFSFLIIPAAIGKLYSDRFAVQLYLGWGAGVAASAFGLGASYGWDLPTGATMVCAFGATLALLAWAKPLLTAPRGGHGAVLRAQGARLATLLLVLTFASGGWLAFNPRADQPLLDAAEWAFPAVRDFFLSPVERDIHTSAIRIEQHVNAEAARINEIERLSRWKGESLSDEEVRRLSSYVQSFQEMGKGEQFVQRELRNKARERQRWAIGVPLALISLALLLLLRARR